MPMSAVAKLAITAAMMAAQMAITASQKFKGPRLEDLNVTIAEYGTAIPRIWGKRRINPQIMWAEKLREKKETSKTKGGKYAEYKYYGTWAVLICDHEIEAVSRIWMDKHLVYDVTGEGPISGAHVLYEFISASENVVKIMDGQNMRIYLGTETQMPDPRMEAWCEDRYGPDSCPAYRGSAYIVFEDLPLDKLGNRIPQVTVEAISVKEDAFPWESKTRDSAISNLQFSPDFSRMVIPTGLSSEQFEVWDTATRTRIILASSLLADFQGPHIGVVPGGSFYAVDGFPAQTLYKVSANGGAAAITSTFEEFAGGCAYVGDTLLIYPYASVSPFVLYLNGTVVSAENPGFIPTHYFADADGDPWGIGQPTVGAGFRIAEMPFGVSASTVASGVTGRAYAMDNGKGSWVVYQNGKLMLVDKATLTITSSVSGIIVSNESLVFRHLMPGSSSIWLQNKEYSTADLSLLQTVTFSDWLAQDVTTALYDPVNHALICQPQIVAQYTWRYLNRVDSDGVPLSAVVDDVAGWCGLTGHDSTALTQTVLGYSVTQGSGKDMIEPLLELHDVDARPHDFSLQFVNRGSAPSGTILTGDFVRDGDEARYKVTTTQDTDLPKKITYTFADQAKDQQANTVIAQRPLDATDSSREESIDLTTYVDTPALAQRKADRYFRRQWNSRERHENTLTAQKLALEPADVTTLSLDGVLRNVRLDKMTIRSNEIACEFVRDEAMFAVLNNATGAEMEGRDPEIIYIPAQTNGFIIDGPLVEDADNDVNPLLYFAAGSFGGSWPGAGVFRGDDGTYDETFAGVDSSSGATWGVANDVLATANPNLWDRGNSVNMTTFGTLTTVTEAEIDADPSLNLIAFGANERWEYIQFATATLEGDGTYTLTGLKRGRRGTEWAVGLHEVGDQFVMLSDVGSVEMGTDDVGDDISFKVQSIGRSIDATGPIDLVYTGATLKPYAPAVQSVTKDAATGDIIVDFDRRTRVGGSWNGSVIPLGEATEEYEMDVLDGADVVRTLTATTSTFTYTSAQQTTDFGAPIAANDLDAMLYQMSATVGRGFAAAA